MEFTASIIPVFNPEPGLIHLAEALMRHFGLVLVVDDGSAENLESFEELPEGVVLLRHEVNRGKGRAMKTALQWIVTNRKDVAVAVFVDGDGQHRAEDAKKIAATAAESDKVVLGVRDFGKSVPFRSRFGNECTAWLVRLMFRFSISDTQTGLRAIPARLFQAMIELPGERYEYEMRLFGSLHERKESLVQVPIQTIYIENNRASHFRPIRDSLRVYHGLFGDRFLRFLCSSGFGFVVDNVVFTGLLFGLQSFGWLRRYEIAVALTGARVLSALVNFLCNHYFVFGSRTGVMMSGMRYVVLVLIIASLSYAGTAALSAIFDVDGLMITVMKLMVETILFLLSYRLQKRWVFTK